MSYQSVPKKLLSKRESEEIGYSLKLTEKSLRLGIYVVIYKPSQKRSLSLSWYPNRGLAKEWVTKNWGVIFTLQNWDEDCVEREKTWPTQQFRVETPSIGSLNNWSWIKFMRILWIIILYREKSRAKCWIYFRLRIDILEFINWRTSAKSSLDGISFMNNKEGK